MKMFPSRYCHLAAYIFLFVAITISVTLLQPPSALWAQSYPVKNDRILAPEVSHFTGVKEPGIDAHGDLHLDVPLMTIPGRDGLNFDVVAKYSAGIKVTQSASWIGIGWSLDVGSITRHPLGGLDGWHFSSNAAQHVDFAQAIAGATYSQPDAYTVTLNGTTVDLTSATLGPIPTPFYPFDPHQSENTGYCGPGVPTPTHSRWHFTASPWRPWKFCYTKSNPVAVDCRSTGTEAGSREDISKLIITTEDGTRYIYGMPTLSYASFPPDHQTGTNYSFVSTWRLIAIHAPNYSGNEIPDNNSTGGWVKIVYKTWHSQTGALVDVETISTGPTCSTGNIVQQATYPYYIETPSHYALFTTSKRYDRDLIKGGLSGAGSDNNYYSRKLDKVTLYKKNAPSIVDPSTDPQVLEAAFTYMNNGANALSNYSQTLHGKMLSKLTLEKITITGLQSNGQGQGTATQSLPSYKFSYYDYKDVNPNDPTGGWLSWDDVAGNPSIDVLKYQDDFGFLDFPPGDSRRNANEAYGTAWSLKEITYPDGGRHRIVYESDKIGTGGISPPPTFTYNVYTVLGVNIGDYQAGVLASFDRTFQGGPRVKAIRTYNGYNGSSPDSVSFAYGEGFYSGITEGKFLKLDNGSQPFYVSGDRGQFGITYAWIEKMLVDNSKIKTHYLTGNGPEFQIFYKGGMSGPTRVILYGNTKWNWGEVDSVKYFDATSALVKKEIYYSQFYGTTPSDHKVAQVVPGLCYGTTCSQGTPAIYLNFTHRQLDSIVTKTYFGSKVVTSREAYEYNSDGTFLKKKTETSGDGKIRKTEYVYAHEISGLPYSDPNSNPTSGMEWRNMRSQTAQISMKDNNATNNGYTSTVTTWKAVGSKYLPDQQFQWRKDKTATYSVPVFNGSTPQASDGWILTQTFDQYDQHGNLTSVKNADGVAASIFWDINAATLIDSIKTRPSATLKPLTAKFTYDPNTFRLTASTDPNGQKTQYIYDPLQRLIEVVMPDKRTAFDYAYYYSRSGNNDNFSPTDPNYVKTRALSGAEFFEPFEYTDAPENHGWGVHYGTGLGTMTTVYDNTLQSRVLRVDVNTGVPNENYAVKYPATGDLGTKSKHLWVKIKSTFGNSSFRVVVLRSGLEYSLRYYFDNGSNGYDSGTRFATFYLGATFKDGNWHSFERDLEQDFEITGLSTSYDYVRRVVAVGEYDLDQIQLQNHPVTSFSYTDGLGRDIQTLQYDKGGAIKAGTYYDALDRVIKVTKPFFTVNKIFTLAVIDSANAYYASNHPAYYNNSSSQEFDTGNYAYSETEYFPDPLNRIRHQYFPGTVFSRADTNYVKYRYGTNAANELSMPANTVFETRVFDENDVKTEIFTDTFGNKVGVRSDSSGANNSGTTTKLATAFQYDILNNLTKIAPPKAFNLNNNNIVDWGSPFCTILTYNTLSQLTSRKTPDSGLDSMYYDKKGNLRFVKDGNGAAGNYFIYYKYDNLGRKIEEGTMSPVSGNFNQNNADIAIYPSTGNIFKAKFQYDSTTYAANSPQRNLRGRLDAIEYVTDRYPNVKGYIFYSYDDNGNVEWIQHFIPKSNVSDGNGNIAVMINYYYDALGKMTKMYYRRTFPPGASADAFYVWYDYDALGRLEKIFSNTVDVKSTTANAQYTYWPGGQVRRLVLGGTVQGVDFLYNSRDWLTQINHQNLNSTQDPGGDGGNSVNADQFGQIIGYNKQDHIAVGNSLFAAQYNGNIAWTITNTSGNTQPVSSSLTGWVFKYDNVNRLLKADWGHYLTSWVKSKRYDLTGRATVDSLVEYDRQGNLDLMLRYNENNVATVMDYRYVDYPNTNKLGYISGMAGHTNFNYKYDASGNMTRDKAKLGSTTADSITYDYRNLPVKIQKSVAPAGTIEFSYDGKGQRVSKNNLFYVPGADGRVLAVYDDKGTLLYWNIWALDLIGQKFWKQ